ncbi:hypothetical protein QBC35DRAFT_381944, partial [Podospora australis]
SEPEPARIASDVFFAESVSPVPPRASNTPDARGRVRKFATTQERNKAISEVLKKRWASGSMNHVHKKRLETQRRKREEAEAEAAAAAAAAAAQQKQNSNGSPNLGGLTSDPADRLARLLADRPAPKPSSISSRSDVGSMTTRSSLYEGQTRYMSDWDKMDDDAEKFEDAVEQIEDAPPESSNDLYGLPPVIDDDEDDDYREESVADEEGVQDETAIDADSVPSGILHPEPSIISSESANSTQPLEIQDSMPDNDDTADSQPSGSVLDSFVERQASQTLVAGRRIFESDVSGRPYKEWTDAHGNDYVFQHLLVPPGYKLDSTVPGRPWVCPIRTCRKAVPKSKDLNCHFERAHYGTFLNDNGDQTFSVVEEYRSKKGSVVNGGRIIVPAPPVVISQDPIAKDSEPPAPVQPPDYLQRLPKYRDFFQTVQEDSLLDLMDLDAEETRALRSLRRRPQVSTQASFRSEARSASQPEPDDHPGSAQMAADNFVLEMEDWELAPGNLREEKLPEHENVAFSKPYLSTGYEVPVHEDVSFRVVAVKPGRTLELRPEQGRTRLCSLASGKVRVTLGEEAPFIIGPSGMFKVKIGVPVAIKNLLYVDAVLHTTVLNF